MTDAERSLDQQMAGLVAMVATARQVLASGRVVDLGDFDERIKRLTADAQALPQAVAARFRPRLVALLDEIDRLETALQAQRAEFMHALGDIAARRRAVSAYGKTLGSK